MTLPTESARCFRAHTTATESPTAIATLLSTCQTPSLDRVVLCTLHRNSTNRVSATVSQQQARSGSTKSQSRRATGTKTSTGTTERRAHFAQRDTYDHWSFRESFARWKFAAASLPRGERGNINYVTIELAGGDRYAAFFDLRRFKKVGPNAVHLMVQSAYVLDPNKPSPGSGRIHFHALLGHALRGTTPRCPP